MYYAKLISLIKKEEIKMNLKSNKGYTGIDISVAMIIILIFIPTIFGIVYNLQRVRAKSEREANSVNVAVDVLEIAKAMPYSDVTISENSAFIERLNNKYSNLQILEDESKIANFTYIDNNNIHYKIEMDITNQYPSEIEESQKMDYVKKITVNVIYPIGNTTKSINISTILKNST